VTLPASATDSELLAYFDACENWSKRVTFPVGWVMDLSRVTGGTARQRALFAEYQERLSAFDRRYTRAAALVISNPVVRGLVTAVYWLKPPVYPYRMFARRGEALVWVKHALADDQLR
jgi:hypothetical protein